MSDLRKVPIKNKVTGEVTMGDSGKVRAAPKSELTDTEHDQGASMVQDSLAEHGASKASLDPGDVVSRVAGNSPVNKPPTGSKKKPKKEIKNLAQFIAYAYSRKGQRLTLKPKTEDAICQNFKLETDVREQLFALAKKDILLAVPRQIILIVRDISGFPMFKSEVRDFILDVLKMHPAFSIPELTGTLNNLEHVPDPKRALTAVAGVDFSKITGLTKDKPLKPKDYEALRENATYCLAVWFVETRSLSLAQVNHYLFTSLWEPQALATTDETERLLLLTGIHDLPGVGIACQSFKQQAEQQMQIANEEKKKKDIVLEDMRLLKVSLEEIRCAIEERDRQITGLVNDLEKERQEHSLMRAHLTDDMERLRARLLRRLNSEVNLLDEGLHALRRDPPKIHVMEDHAERALAGLKREIKELDSDE